MKIIALFILLFFICSGLRATPDDGIIQHETLIGYNSGYYYCIRLTAYPSGTYYAHKDSAFLVARDFRTAMIQQRIFISSREHINSDGQGDWHTTISENKDFSLVDFIKAHSITYLYPEIYRFAVTGMIAFRMGADGLMVKAGPGSSYREVINNGRFHQAAPWIRQYLAREGELNRKYPTLASDKAVNTRYFFGDEQWMFLCVTGEMDAERSEIVLAFDRKELMPLVEKVRPEVK